MRMAGRSPSSPRGWTVIELVAGVGDNPSLSTVWARQMPRGSWIRRDQGGADERALIRAAQGGSEEAIEQLYRRHWGRAHRAAFLIVHDAAVAEDIAQEAFLAALRALDRFDRRRPFGPWLHRIAVNRAIDWARRRALRREVLPGEGGAEIYEAGPGSDPAAGAGRAVGESMLAALAALPADQRGVVVLRHLLDYTPGEIARMLDVPRGTVNSRLRRGLDRLGRELGEEVR
jgi:RNA polymerase sigma-70 factor (ECF subfamily)